MFKAEITQKGVLTNYGEFKTPQDAEAWIKENSEYFPEGFKSTITDTSQLERASKRLEFAERRIAFGSRMIAEIIAINEERLELGTMSEAQFTAMLNDPLLFKIERLFWNGAIMTAKVLIQAMNDDHYNALQKAYILKKVDAFLTSIDEAV